MTHTRTHSHTRVHTVYIRYGDHWTILVYEIYIYIIHTHVFVGRRSDEGAAGEITFRRPRVERQRTRSQYFRIILLWWRRQQSHRTLQSARISTLYDIRSPSKNWDTRLFRYTRKQHPNRWTRKELFPICYLLSRLYFTEWFDTRLKLQTDLRRRWEVIPIMTHNSS